MSVRVYRYGIPVLREGAEVVREQLKLAHRYRDKLTEIERERRAEVRTAYASLVELERAANLAAGEARRDAFRALYDARSELRSSPDVVAAETAANERAAEARRQARSACGVYWGTYLLCEAAADQARKAPLWDGIEPSDPRFLPFRGEGSLGVQVQGGMETKAAYGTGTLIRILGRCGESRSERRRPIALMFRVGSDERGGAVWSTWDLILHRPLPAGRIKWAKVVCRRIGPRERWFFDVSVHLDEDPERRRGPGRAVAIDLGWRVVGDGEIRVGAWRGEDGGSGEFRVVDSEVRAIRKAEELRSIRDKNFDAARAALLEWIRGRDELPDWLAEAKKTLHSWKSQARLAGLARRWRRERFASDETGYDPLEAWRYHDHHLWAWESSQRSKSLGRRREKYRIWAARLAEQYSTLVLEDLDLRPLARRESTDNPHARSNRQLVAASELRAAMIGAFRDVEYERAANTTRVCSECFSVEQWDMELKLWHKCGACGAEWDQDFNAAENLLRLRRERLSSGETPEPTRTRRKAEKVGKNQESKWGRLKRKKRERVAAETDRSQSCAQASEIADGGE